MNKRLAEYKSFVDDLVQRRPCVSVRWIKEGRSWPKLPENKGINKLLAALTPEQNEALCQMLQEARDGGIHDVSAYLTDEINSGALRIARDGIELAVEPYGAEMYFDWFARVGGQEWPDH